MALKHAEPGEVVDLRPLGARLTQTMAHAIVRTPSFEAMRLVVPAGTEILGQPVPGRLMLHCIEGEVELGLADGTGRMRAGHWMYLEGRAEHSLRGIEDSSLLLTILFHD
ncbi:MAG: hypothetical protein AB7O39_17105 [Flavobacteriaceae bacterium]